MFSNELEGPREKGPKDALVFQGVEFDPNVSVNDEAFCLRMPRSMERLVGFLKETVKLNQTKDLIRAGLVLYADDQFIN